MRIFILIALLFAFTAGGFADMAHASAPDHTCVHHQMDQDNNVDNEPCHSEQDHGQCDNCCCMHSHLMAASSTLIKTALNIEGQNIIASADDHYSAELSGIKRPPRL